MKYRCCCCDGALRGYMLRHADKIKEMSKKYKASSKPTVRTATTPWTDEEHGKLCEGYALYKNDYGTIEGYIRTRSATQIESMLIKNADQFNDESEFNIGSGLTQPVELYHVLNIAPHEGFDHIISWNWHEENNCRSFKIHDKGMFCMFSCFLCLFFLLLLKPTQYFDVHFFFPIPHHTTPQNNLKKRFGKGIHVMMERKLIDFIYY
jgi:hypothetical protein